MNAYEMITGSNAKGVYNDVRELIGNTPMVKINSFKLKPGVTIYAKLELWNPAGSVKDRIGVYMLEDFEKRGLLKKGATIVEATAGNTGLGVALAAIGKGYKVIFVVPTKFSEEKQSLMRALGAEIINTPREKGMKGASEKMDELLRTIPGSVSFRQFENQVNPLAHYETTGKEIYEQLDGKVDYLIAGAGSGGTYTGIVRYLKDKNPDVCGVLADPVGSTLGGGEHGDYNIEGVGNDFVPGTMDMSLVDKVIKVTDTEAFETARLLTSQEGIICGSSSGAAMACALKLAEEIESGTIVAVFPDRGDRYFSKGIYK